VSIRDCFRLSWLLSIAAVTFLSVPVKTKAAIQLNDVYVPTTPLPPGVYGPPTPTYHDLTVGGTSPPAYSGWSLHILDWGFNPPTQPSNEQGATIASIVGGTGSPSGTFRVFPANLFRQPGTWYAFRLRAYPTDGSPLHVLYTGLRPSPIY
jgi:hypothetical protein